MNKFVNIVMLRKKNRFIRFCIIFVHKDDDIEFLANCAFQLLAVGTEVDVSEKCRKKRHTDATVQTSY